MINLEKLSADIARLNAILSSLSGTIRIKGNVDIPARSNYKINGADITPWINVKSYGAIGDGSTDDTAAIQAAMTAAGTLGKEVFLPEGKYAVTALTMLEFTSLRGVGFHPQRHDSSYTPSTSYHKGTWLYCTDTTNPAVTLPSGCSISNVAFYYPNQAAGAATPTTYPASVRIAWGATRVRVQDCFFQNSYYAINADVPHESLTVENCAGYPLAFGLVMDNSTDIDRIINVHWNPNCWAEGLADTTTRAWVNANATAFEIKNADWPVFTSCFSFGYNYGFYLHNNGSGQDPQYVVLDKCGIDNARTGIYAIGDCKGLRIINCNINTMDVYAAGVRHGMQLDCFGEIIITGCRIAGNYGDGIRVNNADHVTIANNIIRRYGLSADGSTSAWAIAVYGTASRVVITGNQIDGQAGTYVGGINVAGTGTEINVHSNVIYNTGLYGIALVSGPDRVICKNNQLITTNGLSDGLGAVTKDVASNMVT